MNPILQKWYMNNNMAATYVILHIERKVIIQITDMIIFVYIAMVSILRHG